MKGVAILGADFVPSSLPPAFRIRSFVTHLPEFEWEPTVITAEARHYDTALDPELERLVPSSVRVLRTAACYHVASGVRRQVFVSTHT